MLWNLDLLLIWNCDGVAGNQCSHLLRSQAIKLITLKHLKDRSATKQGIKNITSVKCRSMYESAYERRSRQPWRSANALLHCYCQFSGSHYPCDNYLMPRQLVGWSWLWRNSQQASLTSPSCRRLAAGSRLCTFSSVTWGFTVWKAPEWFLTKNTMSLLHIL